MNVQDAVAQITKLQAEMNQAAANSELSASRYQAHMMLYNVAVQRGDDKEAESQRLILHSHLDGILDAGFEIYSRKKMITDIAASAHD